MSIREWQRSRHGLSADDARTELQNLADSGYGNMGYGPTPGGGGKQAEIFTLTGETGESVDNRLDSDAPAGRLSTVGVEVKNKINNQELQFIDGWGDDL